MVVDMADAREYSEPFSDSKMHWFAQIGFHTVPTILWQHEKKRRRGA